MKILLTGAAGQLGRELKRSLACLGEVIACDHGQLDLTSATALRETVRHLAPSAIVNAAAYTAVDRAESEPMLAQAVNAEAPGVLAEEARRLGALLIHFSTDYVFDGRKPSPYTEADATAPLSVYGRSKREGEQAILNSGARYLILRTSWVFGLHGANFLKTMLRLGHERDELRVIDDQVGAPTWTRHLADVSAQILCRKESSQGIYHLTSAGATSWHGYAEAIFDAGLQQGLLTKKPKVHRITSADYPLPARRPQNSRLDCSRFTTDFALTLPDWRVGLADCLSDARF